MELLTGVTCRKNLATKGQ